MKLADLCILEKKKGTNAFYHDMVLNYHKPGFGASGNTAGKSLSNK